MKVSAAAIMVPLVAVFLAGFIVGLIDAIRRPGWAYQQANTTKSMWVGLIVGTWLIGLGWFFGWIYLLGPGRGVRGEHRSGKRAPAGAPGWYPDENHRGQMRYWDGDNWSAHTQPAAVVEPTC
ncbi:MAG: DUF2510 domain-containing protein [Acidimicrobiales bacterium]